MRPASSLPCRSWRASFLWAAMRPSMIRAWQDARVLSQRPSGMEMMRVIVLVCVALGSGRRGERSIFVAARVALGGDAVPDQILFVLAHEDPVGHLHGGAPAAPADVVVQRGADGHARRIPAGQAVVFVGGGQGGVQGAHGQNNSIGSGPDPRMTLLPAGLWRIGLRQKEKPPAG